MKAVVFCSASDSIDPKFNDEARKVVRALHAHGYDVVSGGTTKGTMKVLVDEAVEIGASHIGIIPRFMEPFLHPDLTETVWTDTMAQRKELMREKGRDLAIALPGGIGTLDEFFETLTLAKLDRYHGRVMAYNYEGFYDKLKDLLDFYVESGMLDGRTRALVSFPENVDQLEELLG